MQILSNEALTILRAGGYVGVTILVDGVSGSITLHESDIIENSFRLDRNSVSGERIEIGNAETSELVFDLDNTDGRFDNFTFEGAQLTVDFQIGNDTLRAGIFTVDQPPRRQDVLHLIALDNMARFNRAYPGSLPFPATLAQILQDVCSQSGVTLATSTFLNSTYTVTQRPEEITCHEIVAAIAELAGSCAWIDWNGELRLSWYADTGAELHLADLFGSYQMAESDISITGFRYKDQTYLIGTDDYAIVIEGNPLLQNNWQTVIDNIHTARGGFAYRPWSADAKGYPHLWPLDVVDPLEDASGITRVGIITNHRYTLGGMSILKGAGETATLTGYATAAPFSARQKTIIQKTVELEASAQVTPIQQMAIQLNALSAGAMGLYHTEVQQQDGSSIQYWHDSATLAGSAYISYYTDAGFLWTNSGWNNGSPVWNYGFTNNGDALFRYLSAAGIHADWITSGRLSSVDGDTYFDLESGIINTPGLIQAYGFTGFGGQGQILRMQIQQDHLTFEWDSDTIFGMSRQLIDIMYPERAQFATDYEALEFGLYQAGGWSVNPYLTLGAYGIGEYPNITKIYGVFTHSNFLPATNANRNLGSSTLKWNIGYINAIYAYSGGFIAYNPNNTTASIALNVNADIPRLRIGGSGAGSTGPFEIQFASDNAALRLTSGGVLTVLGSGALLPGTTKAKDIGSAALRWNYVYSDIFNSSFAADNFAASWYYYDSGDGFHRKKTVANVKAELGINSKANTGQTSAAVLNNTLTATGMYTTSEGGSMGLGGAWWHVWHGYHAADGYAAQLAFEYYGNNNMKFRSSAGTSWGSWFQVSTVGHTHGNSGISTVRYDYSGSIGGGGRISFNTDSEYMFAPCTEGGQFIYMTTGAAAAGYYTRTGIYNPTGNTYGYFIGWRKVT